MWKRPETTARILYFTSIVQIVLNAPVQETIQQTGPRAAKRPGTVSAILPNAGPSGGVQIDRTDVPRVEYQNVDRDGGFHEGLRLDQPQFTVERA